MSHSPHKNWKGCPMCSWQKRRGQGRRFRDPAHVQRRLGLRRRYTRNTIPKEG